MSGKEAQVWLVLSDGEERVAKVYKEADNRSFKHRSAYTEGRKVRNTRKARAMAKRSKYGREQVEAEWRTAEVDAIRRLRTAGVRVPEPFEFIDGVFIMELVADEEGYPAPRLIDLDLNRDEARRLFDILVHEVARMLCAGIVHGDLSDFNVLLAADGPVIIDFPQWVDATNNRNARELLIRDVDNLTSFLARHDPGLRRTSYGQEIWGLYEKNALTPQTRLTGKFKRSQHTADTYALLREFEDLEREAREKRAALGLPPPGPARKPRPAPHIKTRVSTQAKEPRSGRGKKPRGRKKGGRGKQGAPGPRQTPAKETQLFDDLDSLLSLED